MPDWQRVRFAFLVLLAPIGISGCADAAPCSEGLHDVAFVLSIDAHQEEFPGYETVDFIIFEVESNDRVFEGTATRDGCAYADDFGSPGEYRVAAPAHVADGPGGYHTWRGDEHFSWTGVPVHVEVPMEYGYDVVDYFPPPEAAANPYQHN